MKRIITFAVLFFCAISPILVFTAPTIFPRGVTLYLPDKCYNGYTIFSEKHDIKLVDMNGSIVMKWKKEGMLTQPPDTNGNFLIVSGKGPEVGAEASERDWEDNVVWSFIEDIHHDLVKTSAGNYLMIVGDEVPAEVKSEITEKYRKNGPIYSDAIIEVNPEGKVIWEWHEYEHIDINYYCPKCCTKNWTHTNSVQELPENELGKADARFKAGNILVNPRNLNTIYIINKENNEIVWSWGKDVLRHPHYPTMLETGNIICFDNGFHGAKGSRVLEIDPASGDIVWDYYTGLYFYSPTRSSAQKLPNGNVLICESDMGRIFEVTPDKEIVWEYVDPDNMNSYRAFRIPYDHCTQTVELPRPGEVPVIPKVPYQKYPTEEWKEEVYDKK